MTTEEAKKAGFRSASGALYVYWYIYNGLIFASSCYVSVLTANYFPTREKARDALRKRKLDAEHAKWLADMQSQTTPITAEQAKMLLAGDYYWISPTHRRHLLREGFENTPEHIKSISEGSAFFTSSAAQAALDKQKKEAFATSHDLLNPTIDYDSITNPKPTTVRGWLETIPDTAIRVAALRQLSAGIASYAAKTLAEAITRLTPWQKTVEGFDFWQNCYDAAGDYGDPDGDPWPAYPPKAKQVKDGWTDEEIEKSAFKPDAVSHPSHYTSHPSGVECITITKHMNFCRGNAVKYIWRAGQKGDSIDKEIEDIAKAEEYCRIEKERLIALKGAK